MLKSPRTMISERGDGKVMVSIDLERWSKRSSWFVELGERIGANILRSARKRNSQPDKLKANI